MRREEVELSLRERVLYLLQWGAFPDDEAYSGLLEHLLSLPEDDLMALYSFADYGPSEVEEVIAELLREDGFEVALVAARSHQKSPFQHSFGTVAAVVRALRHIGAGTENLTAHLRSHSRCTRIPGREHVPYTENPALMALVEEMPEKAYDIMAARVERMTDDAAVIRQIVSAARPLSDGAL